MGEGPEPSSSSAPGGSAFAEGPDTEMGTPTFNLDDLLRVIQEQEDAEQTETEGASRFRRKRASSKWTPKFP